MGGTLGCPNDVAGSGQYECRRRRTTGRSGRHVGGACYGRTLSPTTDAGREEETQSMDTRRGPEVTVPSDGQ